MHLKEVHKLTTGIDGYRSAIATSQIAQQEDEQKQKRSQCLLSTLDDFEAHLMSMEGGSRKKASALKYRSNSAIYH